MRCFMQKRIFLNNDWKFSKKYTAEMREPAFNDHDMEKVRIPHTVAVTPFHYFDESIYRMISCYRKTVVIDPEWREKRVFLHFDGVAHTAEVFVNGRPAGTHDCGYTAFETELTQFMEHNEDLVITVRVDSTETQNVPPFGHVVDYMTYGGIYREVWLEVREPVYIQDVFVRTKLPKKFCFQQGAGAQLSEAALSSQVCVDLSAMHEDPEPQNHQDKKLQLRQTLTRVRLQETENIDQDPYAQEQLLGVTELEGETASPSFHTFPVAVWDTESPALYLLTTQLCRDDTILDEKTVRFGFRKALFRKDGFYLNGRKLKIRGLNRHQSYPYVGYAMPSSMQRLDADILKKELCVNAVRTSHYPQSHAFIDRCDELGLLVFMEFPGWQHIGDEKWKEQACENLQEMILQFRNHTSIILWGVRINESMDDDSFYAKTNHIAHRLDPTRQTGGVRAIKKSHLLEDVYTYNDFVHNGRNAGCEPKSHVTSDMNRPYLITEYNGHMFPTRTFDYEDKRMEHAIRHANVLDAVAGQEDISGSFGWCMFDYNTHQDFGSGDRVCYHGVMDMFRNPKLAAAVYRSQDEQTDVLEVSSGMDIGEHAECIRGDVWIFTNADAVRMYKNGVFIKEYTPADSPYRSLRHGPVLVDDYIGNQLRDNEKFTTAQADAIRDVMNAAARSGMGDIPLHIKARAARVALQYHMKWEDALSLYNRYIGDWGGKSTEFRFEAIRGGKVVRTVIRKPAHELHIEADVDHTLLTEGETYDVALVRIRATDENGNVLPLCMEPVELQTEGALELIGPAVVPFRGGMTGTFVRTKGQSGSMALHITCGSQKITVPFQVSFS